jgi:CxxC motif-containing protein (DUF1111 family)
MHDSASFSLTDAIRRHGNQASSARDAFNALSTANRNRLFQFLLSL